MVESGDKESISSFGVRSRASLSIRLGLMLNYVSVAFQVSMLAFKSAASRSITGRRFRRRSSSRYISGRFSISLRTMV